jgi:hypothetical protein
MGLAMAILKGPMGETQLMPAPKELLKSLKVNFSLSPNTLPAS